MSKKKKDQAVEEAAEAVESVASTKDADSTESIEPTEEAAAEQTIDWKDKYLRALAEAENVRKRTERERIQTHKYALEDVLRNILPVLDSLHYALKAEDEAVGMRPDSAHPAGTVIEEERRGYKLHDRVLRPSRVQISEPPALCAKDGDAGPTLDADEGAEANEATAEES